MHYNSNTQKHLHEAWYQFPLQERFIYAVKTYQQKTMLVHSEQGEILK